MRIPRNFLVSAALAAVLLITLWAGLKPKGYRFRNDVAWMSLQGISIGRIGIVYSRDSLQWMDQNSGDSGFTIEISLKARSFRWGGALLSFWDGSFPELFKISQRLDHLIVRVRDLHEKQGFQEFYVDPILERGKTCLLCVVSTKSMSTLYYNGLRIGDPQPAPIFRETGLRCRLVVGNSVTGGEPWRGEIYGMALYNREISSNEIASRFSQWDSSGRTFLPSANGAAHLYQFNEKGGPVAHDWVGSSFDLQIPRLFHIIKKRVLGVSWKDFQNYSDVAINFFGFMPFGFFVSLFLFHVVKIPFWKRTVLLTIFICFILSLGIELVQVYIPTRDSQLTDLFFNTLGGGCGGLLMITIRSDKFILKK